jgi:hypothetical protein
MDTVFGIISYALIGIGLAASCGFRVFVPMLVMSVAVRAGLLQLTEGWQWIGSWPALISFSVAAIAEVAGFYIPFVAHLLDVLAAPAAVVAGTVATAACVAEMHPLVQWSAAIIAGGGIAAAVHTATATVRAGATATTAGLASWIVATLELVTSFVLSVLAIVVPILAAVLICVTGFFVGRWLWRRKARAAQAVPDGSRG